MITVLVFFFIDAPPPYIYPLSRHAAFPFFPRPPWRARRPPPRPRGRAPGRRGGRGRCPPRRARRRGNDRGCGADRKSTRLNSSHANISYAVFCLKKKKKEGLTHGL